MYLEHAHPAFLTTLVVLVLVKVQVICVIFQKEDNSAPLFKSLIVADFHSLALNQCIAYSIYDNLICSHQEPGVNKNLLYQQLFVIKIFLT